MRKFVAVVAAVAVLGSASVACAMTLADAQGQVQREARFYRITVYKTYRTLRPQYNARRTAGTEAYSAWKQAGGQAHQAEPLLTWYREAKLASQPGVNMPLPPLPQFPEALATTPPAAADAVHARPTRRRTANPSKHYRVQEVATRSADNPYPHPTPNRHVEQQPADSPSAPVWRSLSRALWKGMTFSSTREESK